MRVLVGPWRWTLLVYIVVTIQDARAAAAATSER